MRRRFGGFVSAQNTFLALALLIPFSSKLKWFPNNARANQNRFFSLLRACLHPSLGAFFFVVVVVRMRKKKFKKCENQGHLGLAQGPSKAHVQAFDEAWALFFASYQPTWPTPPRTQYCTASTARWSSLPVRGLTLPNVDVAFHHPPVPVNLRFAAVSSNPDSARVRRANI